MSANDQGILAGTGRAHCQRQVAFLFLFSVRGRVALQTSEKEKKTWLKELTLWIDLLPWMILTLRFVTQSTRGPQF